MTVFVGKHFQPTTRWLALDINDKWRIGRLVTENGKRYIAVGKDKFEIKASHEPKVYK